MSGMVERVARLLCEQNGGDPDAVASEPHDCWEGLLWTVFVGDAKAVLSVVAAQPTDAQVREAMQTAWDDFCDDAQAIPGDIYREGRKTFFRAGTWADHTAMHLRAALSPSPSPGGEVAR